MRPHRQTAEREGERNRIGLNIRHRHVEVCAGLAAGIESMWCMVTVGTHSHTNKQASKQSRVRIEREWTEVSYAFQVRLVTVCRSGSAVPSLTWLTDM